jgi:hypothetical protein
VTNDTVLHGLPLVASVPAPRKMNRGFLKHASPINVVKEVASCIHCNSNDVMNCNAIHTAAMSQIQAYIPSRGMEIWQHCGQKELIISFYHHKYSPNLLNCVTCRLTENMFYCYHKLFHNSSIS